MKARIVEQEEAAFVRQWHGKHVSAATNKHAAIEELLEEQFSTQSIPRLYNKDQNQKSVTCKSALAVGG
jgi:hypothetical protein